MSCGFPILFPPLIPPSANIPKELEEAVIALLVYASYSDSPN